MAGWLFINEIPKVNSKMDVFEVIYKEGSLKLVGTPKIEKDVIRVKILNRDEILTRDDTEDILNALKEKSEGKLSSFEEVFE